jgi:exopolysaccharide biosynthesis polyprenyl glycosylphosphotransferase
MSVKSDTGIASGGVHTLSRPSIDSLAEREQRAKWGDRFWGRARFAVDLSLLVLAVAIADVWSRDGATFAERVLWPALFVGVVLCTSYARGAYRRRLKLDSLDDLVSTGWVLAVATAVVVTARVLFDAGTGTAATETVRLGLIAATLVGGGRVAVNLWQLQTRRHGKALVPTLIVGAGHIGRTTAKRLLEHPELGLEPIGFLDKEPLEAKKSARRLPVLGASWDLDRVASEYGVGQVIVTFSTAPSDVLLRLVNRCEQLGIAVALVPRLFEKTTRHLTVEHLGGVPLITSRRSDPRGWQFAIKYALDRIVAFVLIALLLPVLAICALAVLLTMGRPILFRQPRTGLDGHQFDMLKFRSMTGSPTHSGEADADWFVRQLDKDSEEEEERHGAAPDQRITLLGRFLRATWIDELPQLFNVLKGDMSLVGPRPERTSYVPHFEQRIYRYSDRHRVKAGITGWAQVHGLRGKTSLADRVEWDNYYIENASLWLDLKILGMTVRSAFRLSAHRDY